MTNWNQTTVFLSKNEANRYGLNRLGKLGVIGDITYAVIDVQDNGSVELESLNYSGG